MAKDIYHDYVREALVKEGWTITHDPYSMKDYDPGWEIDLGAEKLIAAEKGTDKIAVEIKTFGAESFAYEFHRVLGQYLNYAAGLETIDPQRRLFVAVPVEIYESEFQRKGIRISIEKYKVSLLIFNVLTKTVEQWII
jgi:XisH protein